MCETKITEVGLDSIARDVMRWAQDVWARPTEPTKPENKGESR